MAALEPVLRGLARRLTGNDSDTEDLLQDCLQRAESQGREYVDPSEEPAVTPDPPGEPIWAELDLADLQRALEGLEPEFRTPYELKELQGLSYKEIAKEIGVPVPTVATRIYRA